MKKSENPARFVGDDRYLKIFNDFLLNCFYKRVYKKIRDY